MLSHPADLIKPQAPEVPVGSLPDEVLSFVMPSRFCLPDELGHEAWQRFGDLTPGWGRVQAIVDYVHGYLEFPLHVRPDTASVPVTVAVADANAGVALVLAAEGGRFAAVEPFGVLTSAVSSTLLFGGNIEMLAQAKHAQFVRDLTARGQTRADHPAIVPWGELPESLKEANRRFADSVGRTFEAAGCVLVPLPLRDSEAPTYAFTADELESLARAEHDRWMSDALADGWRPTDNTTDPKDAQRKLHPLLVPWEQLSEEEREKDRDTIRELPGIVELAGFRVQRP